MRLVRSVQGVRLVLSIVWLMALGGWLLVFRPRWNAGGRGIIVRAVLMLVRYAAFWALVAVIIRFADSTILVGSRSGLQTALQVLPASIVAMLVLTLGSLFVIAQNATTTWGTRAPLMLTVDNEVAIIVGRPLLLAAASVLLAGQVPDQGATSPWMTAAVAALVFATVRLLLTVVMLSAALLQRYALPRGFPQHVIADLDRELEAGELTFVVSRGPMLGEMARMALRRGDSIAFKHVLEAMSLFQQAVVAATTANPALGTFTTEEGVVRTRWLAEDISAALTRVGEEALLSGAPTEDLNLVAQTLGRMAVVFAETGDEPSAERVAAALIHLGTSAYQVTPEVTNYFVEPAFQLALVEAAAEAADATAAATYALAGWALCTAYPLYHFGAPAHPLFAVSVAAFGAAPPWRSARALVQTDDWQRAWAFKQYQGPAPLIDVLDEAERARQCR